MERTEDPALDTPLTALMRAQGGRIVPYAGHALPVQFPAGVMAEHLHTRAAASLFDVSHMGQVVVQGAGAARALETLIPANLIALAPGRQRYGLLTAPDGGIRDDLMVARLAEDRFLLVVNGACKWEDLAHLQAHLPGCAVTMPADRALIALQGPQAVAALARLAPDVSALRFLDVREMALDGIPALVARAGYTGEDGVEISVPADMAEGLARRLLDLPGVRPAGLGARDSLRLEAGLPLMGNDMGPDTTPAEAGLAWAIPKVRRTGGARAGGFPGAHRILPELAGGAGHTRCGLRPEGRAPLRAGVVLYRDADSETPVGHVTSGGYGPSVEGPVAMACLRSDLCDTGLRVHAAVRGKRLPALVTPLPFLPPKYKR